jgi:uncharacterized protein (TIGR01732 family)
VKKEGGHKAFFLLHSKPDKQPFSLTYHISLSIGKPSCIKISKQQKEVNVMCYAGYGGGYGNGGFFLIVVLFILLVIVGASYGGGLY